MNDIVIEVGVNRVEKLRDSLGIGVVSNSWKRNKL